MTYYGAQIPKTHKKLSDFDRVKVDPGQTNFWLGRQGRTFREFSIAQGATLNIQIVATTIPFIAMKAGFSLDQGYVRMATKAGGTPGGTWTAMPIINLNDMPVGKQKLEAYALTLTVGYGGTQTGGTERDVVRSKVAANSNFSSSIPGTDDLPRAVPAGAYYYSLQNIGNDTALGVFSFFWEERPLTD